MIFSKMARQFLLRVSRIPLLAAAMAAAVVVSAPLGLGAQENGKDRSGLGPGRDEAPARNRFEVAQGYGRPPGDVGEPGDVPYGGEPPDGGQLLVRIGRIESQIREINGQIEQMQFETRKLEEQLRKFQEDVDFRFREGGPGAPAAKPPQKHSESTGTPAPAEAQLATPGAAVPPPRASGRGDAFDPSQNPDAPGSPRPLGSHATAAVSNPGSARAGESASPGLDQSDPGAPLDLSNGRSRTPAATPPLAMAPSAGSASGTVIATAPKSAREEFDIALAFLKQRSYEDAERGFTSFLQKNPKNKLAPDAIYFLGESFYRRGRQREAAEQFLKLSAQYADSPRAPEALLRLGQSLNALGAKEQACATYGEIARKYPDAPAMVKVGAEREVKRAQC